MFHLKLNYISTTDTSTDTQYSCTNSSEFYFIKRKVKIVSYLLPLNIHINVRLCRVAIWTMNTKHNDYHKHQTYKRPILFTQWMKINDNKNVFCLDYDYDRKYYSQYLGLACLRQIKSGAQLPPLLLLCLHLYLPGIGLTCLQTANHPELKL